MFVGFCDFAEKLNGRACMIGFVAMFFVEGAYGFFHPHAGIFQLLGLSVGNGLGFEL
jgi:L-lactate permease